MSVPGGGPGLANLQFLVVDDHAQIRSLVRTILFALGGRNILDAADGEEGLKVAAESAPDIVITDWAMEPMSGVEMVKIMRQSSNDILKYMPIIMLTAFSERGRIVSARDAGINEYLLKPVSPRSLYSRVRAIIEQPRRFVRTKSYFGPDRRRGEETFNGPDKRGTGEEGTQVDMSVQMTQDEIEAQYFMPTESGSTASAEQYVSPGIRRAQELAKKNRR
ncbi:MAG: response regulator [Alphaproteobacteria bacterium]|nr:response regulator [Alphaproteobacteria bacterium]